VVQRWCPGTARRFSTLKPDENAGSAFDQTLRCGRPADWPANSYSAPVVLHSRLMPGAMRVHGHITGRQPWHPDHGMKSSAGPTARLHATLPNRSEQSRIAGNVSRILWPLLTGSDGRSGGAGEDGLASRFVKGRCSYFRIYELRSTHAARLSSGAWRTGG
jgi:hypothetical protein